MQGGKRSRRDRGEYGYGYGYGYGYEARLDGIGKVCLGIMGCNITGMQTPYQRLGDSWWEIVTFI